MRTATGLAAAIKKEFGFEAKIKKGPIGLFDVYLDESVVYSNRREGGRLPKSEEVLERIRDLLSAPAQPKKTAATGKSPAAAAPESQCGCG